MKKLITILFLIFLFNAFSQTPESFNYQAVIRNSSGDIISNQTIGVQFRILNGSASGNSTYQETFTIETSGNGLIALQIGSGNTVSGDFATIDWGNGPFFLETSVDLNGGSSFEVMGTSQLVSVPYALYAKNSGSSIPGPQGESGNDGKTILNGTIAPTTEGADGDFYINTATSEIYGPKSVGTWGTATSLVGVSGSDGSDGQDGSTILNGTVAPTNEGVDGDFYINTATSEIYGPKTTGTWGSAISLIGVNGNNGSDGSNGNTVLSGTVTPSTEGVNGDFYINTATNEIYGPKTADAWGAATSLVGTSGSNGADGNDGKTILNGTVAPTTEGVDGDFFINTATNEIYGPKTGGIWGTPISLVGATGPQGPAGADGSTIGNATYRWATFSTYSNHGSGGWAFNNDPNMFGGVAPSNWTDASAIASQMSADKEVLRTLFQRKGYSKSNAMIVNDELASFSSTNGRVATVLFRIRNTTSNPITWSPTFWYSAYAAWGERASIALNGSTEMSEGNVGNKVVDIIIPPNRTSTVIFVSTSSSPSIGASLRLCRLGFTNNSLDLPAGLEFIDDLDTATGGWEQ